MSIIYVLSLGDKIPRTVFKHNNVSLIEHMDDPMVMKCTFYKLKTVKIVFTSDSSIVHKYVVLYIANDRVDQRTSDSLNMAKVLRDKGARVIYLASRSAHAGMMLLEQSTMIAMTITVDQMLERLFDDTIHINQDVVVVPSCKFTLNAGTLSPSIIKALTHAMAESKTITVKIEQYDTRTTITVTHNEIHSVMIPRICNLCEKYAIKITIAY